MTTSVKGKTGEALAARYLQKQGYEILASNYRYKKAEIDLITRQGKLIVFVEVKLRTSLDYGLPEQAVTPQKQALILLAAENYLVENNLDNDIRFDIISIINDEIDHFEDAFY